jgi:hypothetical protein
MFSSRAFDARQHEGHGGVVATAAAIGDRTPDRVQRHLYSAAFRADAAG